MHLRKHYLIYLSFFPIEKMFNCGIDSNLLIEVFFLVFAGPKNFSGPEV